MIEIWHPRYKDRKVLVAKYKVKDGLNQIRFTKAKFLLGKDYYMTGEKIKTYPLSDNGKIPCYEVDLDDLISEEAL